MRIPTLIIHQFPLPPPEPPDEEFDFEIKISVVRSAIVKPLIPIHIVEEERIRREHADYINRMEMLFTINPRPHPIVNANTNVESIPSFLIPVQDNDSQREEIDIITVTDDVLPPSIENDDSDRKEVAVDDLHVDNSISNYEHEFFESEDFDLITPQFHYHLRNHQMKNLILRLILEMKFQLSRSATIKHSYSNDDTYFSIDVIDEILEEDFDALLDEGSKILHSIEGTILEEEIFSEFDKFIEMNANENYDSESDTEEPPFEKITINTDYKSKTSLEEPPTDLELKLLPDNLEYVFLEEPYFFPVIISS
nr:reverse transcriptase domain-containing protein [Tanacetum cinerariifolium]